MESLCPPTKPHRSKVDTGYNRPEKLIDGIRQMMAVAKVGRHLRVEECRDQQSPRQWPQTQSQCANRQGQKATLQWHTQCHHAEEDQRQIAQHGQPDVRQLPDQELPDAGGRGIEVDDWSPSLFTHNPNAVSMVGMMMSASISSPGVKA